MTFTVIEEEFGSLHNPYSNDPKVDVKCIIHRIQETKSTASERHVFFVGESHTNEYDTQRRKNLISYIVNKGFWKFPKGVPKVIAERFGSVEAKHVYMKEPALASDLPDAFRKLRKPDVIGDEAKATGVFSKDELLNKQSGPASQSRNQWFAFAIMKAIADTAEKPVPIIVVCGADHEKYLRAALSDLAKSGYSGSVDVVWHYFPPAPDTVKPKDEVLASFKFSTANLVPAGYIRSRMNDAELIKLESGHLKKPLTLEVIAPFMVIDEVWALFLNDKSDADYIRDQLESTGKTSITLTADTPAIVEKVSGPTEIEERWPSD